MRNVTFTADEELIDKARLRARHERTTLNTAFREWLQRYAGTGAAGEQYRYLMRGLSHVKSDRKFTREEMNSLMSQPSRRCFLDTNILVYTFLPDDWPKRDRARWIGCAGAGKTRRCNQLSGGPGVSQCGNAEAPAADEPGRGAAISDTSSDTTLRSVAHRAAVCRGAIHRGRDRLVVLRFGDRKFRFGSRMRNPTYRGPAGWPHDPRH